MLGGEEEQAEAEKRSRAKPSAVNEPLTYLLRFRQRSFDSTSLIFFFPEQSRQSR